MEADALETDAELALAFEAETEARDCELATAWEDALAAEMLLADALDAELAELTEARD